MKNTSLKSNGQGMAHKDSALFDLFVAELRDIYWAEKHIIKNLPKMVKAATSEDLKNALKKHLAETENQVERLEEVFHLIDTRAIGKRCEGMDGLVDEAKTIMDATEDGTLTRDVGIIFATQKIEHYEIATYGTLKTIASVLELDNRVVDLLAKNLEEEKNADSQLTQISESHINQDACEEKS